jgi:CRISPR-associated endonuclease/helicase Cas3
VATSAGAVGVDLDADHMVCDLVAWERMVQRCGREKRRGGKDKRGKDREADIVVFIDPEPTPPELKAKADEKVRKKQEAAIEKHNKLVAEGRKSKRPFGEALTAHGDGSFDVSPEALRLLSERAHNDDALSRIIMDASSPAPLRPALNRALVDAWAMTSLPEHTGRPEVEPWLRGWVDDLPQTTVVWRKYLPVRSEPTVRKKEIEDFFEAAPIHASETLETETFRVMKWLQARTEKLDKAKGDEKLFNRDAVIGMLLKSDGQLARVLELGHLLGDAKEDKRRHEDIERDLTGKTLVMDARFAGLQDGLLNDAIVDPPATADSEGGEWIASDNAKPIIRFRILERGDESDETAEKEWRESLRFDLKLSADGEATRWLSIQKWRDTSNTENDRAAGRPQSLTEHQSWAAIRAGTIGERLLLPDEYRNMLCIAARLHDEGKKAVRWQRAFRAERDARKFGIDSPLAKTRGPINQALLDGYRHEFGSLRLAKEDVEFKELPEELQDLTLHLIASHHGYARPLIATSGCDDAPPSVLTGRAREVALRYAHLQERWGPWGLAWWESLLRAADVQASRANDEKGQA